MTREELSAMLVEYSTAEPERQGEIGTAILDENDRIVESVSTATTRADEAETRANASDEQYRKLQGEYVKRFLGAVPSEKSPRETVDENGRTTYESLFE